MPPIHGFDEDRDQWSIEATERLFPPIAWTVFRTKPENITYAWHSDINRLDTQYGIDCLLKTEKRNVALAVRIRGIYYYITFGDITIRYDSLQTLGKMLEMQKSIARFMFYGWGDTNSPGVPKKLIREGKVDRITIKPPDCLIDWHVIWLQRLIDLYLKGNLQYQGPYLNGDGSSRLVGISLSELTRHNLIYKSKSDIEDETDLMKEIADLRYEQGDLFDLNESRYEAYLNELHHKPYIYD